MSRTLLKQAAIPSKEPFAKADIILVHLDHNETTPWVTWQKNVHDGSTYWGHYHRDQAKAEAEFKARCEAKGAVEYGLDEIRPNV